MTEFSDPIMDFRVESFETIYIKEEPIMANKKFFEVIGAAALIGAIYKIGELKGSITTGLRFAKNPEKGKAVMQVINETDKAFKALDEGKKVNVKVTKDDFICEVEEPAEEAEETAEEAEEPEEE